MIFMASRVRRVRRWARTTPNGQIGMTLIGVGCLCVLVVAVLVGFEAHWI
jgi:hypothetical protein